MFSCKIASNKNMALPWRRDVINILNRQGIEKVFLLDLCVQVGSWNQENWKARAKDLKNVPNSRLVSFMAHSLSFFSRLTQKIIQVSWIPL